MTGKNFGGKGATLLQEQVEFSPAERKRFEAARKKLAARIRPQIRAIKRSQAISHEDLAICINSKE
jgi:hypothetical protein